MLDLSLPLAMVGQIRRFAEALEQEPAAKDNVRSDGFGDRRQWREYMAAHQLQRLETRTYRALRVVGTGAKRNSGSSASQTVPEGSGGLQAPHFRPPPLAAAANASVAPAKPSPAQTGRTVVPGEAPHAKPPGPSNTTAPPSAQINSPAGLGQRATNQQIEVSRKPARVTVTKKYKAVTGPLPEVKEEGKRRRGGAGASGRRRIHVPDINAARPSIETKTVPEPKQPLPSAPKIGSAIAERPKRSRAPLFVLLGAVTVGGGLVYASGEFNEYLPATLRIGPESGVEDPASPQAPRTKDASVAATDDSDEAKGPVAAAVAPPRPNGHEEPRDEEAASASTGAAPAAQAEYAPADEAKQPEQEPAAQEGAPKAKAEPALVDAPPQQEPPAQAAKPEPEEQGKSEPEEQGKPEPDAAPRDVPPAPEAEPAAPTEAPPAPEAKPSEPPASPTPPPKAKEPASRPSKSAKNTALTPAETEALLGTAISKREVLVTDRLLVVREQTKVGGWGGANRRCSQMKINGVGGWRLPFRRELVLLGAVGIANSGVYWSRSFDRDDAQFVFVYDSAKRRLKTWLRLEKNGKSICVRKR